MRKLIDLEAAIEVIRFDSGRTPDDLDAKQTTAYRNGMYAAISSISSCPTIDAVPVVHGRWGCTYDEKTGKTDVTCSHCKDTRTINGCYVTSAGESCYFDDNYCPNCGAKMGV